MVESGYPQGRSGASLTRPEIERGMAWIEIECHYPSNDSLRGWSFSRHDVKNVPVLRVANRGFVVFFLFSKQFDVEAGEELLHLGTRVAERVGAAAPVIALAEELAGEAPAGFDGRDDPLPQFVKLSGRAEGESVTAVEQVAGIPMAGGEGGELHSQQVSVFGLDAIGEHVQAALGHLDGVDVPTAGEEFQRVAAFATGEVNGELWCGGSDCGLSIEEFECFEKRVARGLALDDFEVAVPVVFRGEVLGFFG